MRALKSFVAAALLLAFANQAPAATVGGLTSVGSVTGTGFFYMVPTVGTGGGKASGAQVAAYINGLFNGDCVVTATGAISCTKTGGVAFGALATVTPGTGVPAALALAPGAAGSVVLNGGALGTPPSGNGSNLTALNASNLSAGTVPAARGGAGTIAGALKGSGAGVVSQAGCGDLSNAGTACQAAVGTAGATLGLLNTANAWSATQTFSAITLTGASGCATFTSGVLGSTGAACGGSGSTGANPTATAGPTAINGSAGTYMRSDAAPAVQTATTSQLGLVQPDGATIQVAAGVISAPPSVTSRTVTGTTDTILAADRGNIVYYNSASAVAISQPAPSGSFANGFFVTLCNINTGVATITPGSGTIGGGSTYPLPTGGSASAPNCLSYQSNGTNFNVVPSWMINASLLTAGTIPAARLPFGTNVATAAANTLSSAGGLTSTIASGTATLGTAAIASGACATVVTVTATNVATTDVLSAGYNGDPTSVTGYGASSTGAVLTVYPYPTSGNANFKVCNSTASSITPGAMTLNWRATR